MAQTKNAAGAVVASFGYDALGRRHSKTVDGVASGYLYDGANIAQELIGVNASNANAANVRANYLSGGVDEVFAQWSGSGAGARTSHAEANLPANTRINRAYVHTALKPLLPALLLGRRGATKLLLTVLKLVAKNSYRHKDGLSKPRKSRPKPHKHMTQKAC